MRTNGGYCCIQLPNNFWAITKWNKPHKSWILFSDKCVNIYSTLDVYNIYEKEIKPPIKKKIMGKVELTPDGESKLFVLLDWLEERGLKDLFLKRVKENKREGYGMEELIKEVNDMECFMVALMTMAFPWGDTPEGEKFWVWVYNCFDKYLMDN